MDAITAFVQRLSRAVPVVGAARRRLVAEAEDHLREATRTWVSLGLSEGAAAQHAIREFGSVEDVAAAFGFAAAQATVVPILGARSAGMMEMEVVGIRVNLMSDEKLAEWARAGSNRDAEQFRKLPIILLRPKDEVRYLPIWCGAAEAAGIAAALQGETPDRPTTHDFAANVFKAFDDVQPGKAVITKLEGNNYFAEVHVTHAGRNVAIDARPSDAIAVAVRLGIPVCAEEGLRRVLVEVRDSEVG